MLLEIFLSNIILAISFILSCKIWGWEGTKKDFATVIFLLVLVGFVVVPIIFLWILFDILYTWVKK
jgi:hypothetical protein